MLFGVSRFHGRLLNRDSFSRGDLDQSVELISDLSADMRSGHVGLHPCVFFRPLPKLGGEESDLTNQFLHHPRRRPKSEPDINDTTSLVCVTASPKGVNLRQLISAVFSGKACIGFPGHVVVNSCEHILSNCKGVLIFDFLAERRRI